MKEKKIVLRQLDAQLVPLRDTGALNIPKQGWVRTIRKAIGMTIKQLASQLQVDPSRVVKIESSEPEGAITLKTLESVAEKMNCKLVYAFLPNTSLEKMIEQKARELAIQQVKRTSHTMDLEDQSVDMDWKKEQVEELSHELLRQSRKHLWEE